MECPGVSGSVGNSTGSVGDTRWNLKCGEDGWLVGTTGPRVSFLGGTLVRDVAKTTWVDVGGGGGTSDVIGVAVVLHPALVPFTQIGLGKDTEKYEIFLGRGCISIKISTTPYIECG